MQDTTATFSVSDDVVPSSGLPSQERHTVRGDRSQTERVRGAGLIAWFDALGGSVAALALVSAHPSVGDGGLGSFLSMPMTGRNVLFVLLVAGMWPLVFYLYGLYEVSRIRRPEAEAIRVLAATSTGSGLAFAFLLTGETAVVSSLPRFWLASLTLCLLFRTSRRALERVHRRHPRRAVIIGTGDIARRAYEDIQFQGLHRYEVVAFLDDASSDAPWRGGAPLPPFAPLDQLEQLLMRDVIDEVVVALPVKSRYDRIQYAITVCERAGVQAKYAADMFKHTVAFPRYDLHGDRAFVAMHVTPDGPQLLIKRAIDIVGATIALLLLTPLMLIVAAAIKLTSSGPIVFTQGRAGLGRRPFRMYKFRSMSADADRLQALLEERNEARGPVFKIRNDPRITPLGRFLRKSSIDEIPQLWNVLIGDMSLVGPRPLPWRDVHRITRPSDMRRFSMRPGITCLWQVQGRSNLDFERWVELDLEYIDRWSLAMDAQILIRTFPAVLSGNGAT